MTVSVTRPRCLKARPTLNTGSLAVHLHAVAPDPGHNIIRCRGERRRCDQASTAETPSSRQRIGARLRQCVGNRQRAPGPPELRLLIVAPVDTDCTTDRTHRF